ncbi:F0F1 ATP synthase subunit A [Actinoalloteichus hymeniacidonis]|uniref:ATP synthase subunit a n=1 Tax=Actinoalloteichus hymeniacidonis TaxID=340345 RepID=A0AAC9MXF8_9PSEU|nr:F0F1 ATP synthase subunit A [Actinoalloteichus hymeniacidonis]AOS62279.1 F0F1-type ATP synthase, alpha subunit [Actinoalloteichus hymeniacidonis]MBB5909695.1 F-type H+-transporting ATPase subunit a [Actinoalloteichus hymeniacidonis]
MLAATLAAGGAPEFHAPGLEEFYPAAVLFEGTIFEINRIMLIRLLVVLALSVFFIFALRRTKLVPRGIQNFAEWCLDFVRLQIAEEILGKVQGRRFLPVLMILFFGIFGMNITGVIPFLNIGASSLIGFPLVMALFVWVVFITAGIKAQGGGAFLKNTIMPPGVPGWMAPIIVPIEFASAFVVRPFSLTVRLLANMLAGHIILVLFFSATHFLFFEAGSALFAPAGLLTLTMGFAFTLFEIMVAVLQAYIFTLLAAVYIDLSQHAEH